MEYAKTLKAAGSWRAMTMLRVSGGWACLAGALAPFPVTCLLWGIAAFAADLGGDCCADLEERVAELEATTVDKAIAGFR